MKSQYMYCLLFVWSRLLAHPGSYQIFQIVCWRLLVVKCDPALHLPSCRGFLIRRRIKRGFKDGKLPLEEVARVKAGPEASACQCPLPLCRLCQHHPFTQSLNVCPNSGRVGRDFHPCGANTRGTSHRPRGYRPPSAADAFALRCRRFLLSY